MVGVPHAERMSALDAGFLVAETTSTPMHIGVLMVLERRPFTDESGRVRLDALRQHVADRLPLVPRMRQVVREVPLSLGRPVWIDDHDFEIEHHIRLLELPAPGDHESLIALTEELAMTTLDRARPLWEWWLIDGLDDSGVEGGRLGAFVKVHHCLVDGVGGIELLFSFTDEAGAPPSVDASWIPRSGPSGIRLVASTAVEGLRTPLRTVGTIGDLARSGRHGLARVTGAVGTLAGMLRPSTFTPSLSLNRRVGHHRHLRTISFDLDELKRIGSARHTKVNDVILTIVCGGLRALLVARGEPLTGQHVQVLVPENVRRDPGTRSLGNRITGFFVSLPVDHEDPDAMLREIRAATRRERRDHTDAKTADLLQVADLAPYALVQRLGPLINSQPWANTLVTNVPGPPAAMHIAGARVLWLAPLVPLAGNMSLAVAVLSYGNDVNVTLNVCRDACPDVDVMVDGMRATATDLADRVLSR